MSGVLHKTMRISKIHSKPRGTQRSSTACTEETTMVIDMMHQGVVFMMHMIIEHREPRQARVNINLNDAALA